jgi:ubiquinone/menaquinone biosynthesis C-methylase UbiE
MLKVAAALYDRLMAGVEEAGLTTWRAELLSPLHGSVLEIGAGTGRNVSLYPATVTTLVLAEPDRHMRAQLQKVAGALNHEVTVVDAPAERLPFDDACFDAVVSTLVLCSVADQHGALAEIHRVLRPGGALVFIEHVAAEDRPRRLRWQRRIEPCWRVLAGNCHLTRHTEEAIDAADLRVTEIERASMRKAPPVVRPTIRGRAIRD